MKDKIKVNRKQFDELVKVEISRLKNQDTNIITSGKKSKPTANMDRAYRSIGTLGGG